MFMTLETIRGFPGGRAEHRSLVQIHCYILIHRGKMLSYLYHCNYVTSWGMSPKEEFPSFTARFWHLNTGFSRKSDRRGLSSSGSLQSRKSSPALSLPWGRLLNLNMAFFPWLLPTLCWEETKVNEQKRGHMWHWCQGAWISPSLVTQGAGERIQPGFLEDVSFGNQHALNSKNQGRHLWAWTKAKEHGRHDLQVLGGPHITFCAVFHTTQPKSC